MPTIEPRSRTPGALSASLALLLLVSCTGTCGPGRPEPAPPRAPAAGPASPAPERGPSAPDETASGRSRRLWDPSTPDSGDVVQGIFALRGAPAWRPCAADAPWAPVSDGSGRILDLLRDLSPSLDAPLAVVARGRWEEIAGERRLLLRELLRVRGSSKCAEMPRVNHWVAEGLHPAPWSAEVGPDGILFESVERSAPLSLPPGRSSLPGGPARFSAKDATHRARLSFEERPCRLGEGGDHAHLTVRAEIDGREYLGCGLAGVDLPPPATSGSEAGEPARVSAGATGATPTGLETAISEWSALRGFSGARPALAVGIDLDGDGALDDALALLDRCDSTGCLLACLLSGPEGLEVVSATQGVRLPVLIGGPGPEGLRDLFVGSGTSGAGRTVRLRFEGRSYPARAAALPAVAPSELASARLALGPLR